MAVAIYITGGNSMPRAVLPATDKLLDAEQMETLCSLPGPCFTIFLPPYRKGEQAIPDSARLKHLLRMAAELPETQKLSQNAEDWLAPLRELAESDELESGG